MLNGHQIMTLLVKYKVCILLVILKFVFRVVDLMLYLKADKVELRIGKVYEF